MDHHVEAALAGSELADLFENNKGMFKIFKSPSPWTVIAKASPDRNWPYPDGMLTASSVTTSGKISKTKEIQIALEYKRPNEGVHGVLTALGQAFAYISKGYQGTVIVIPETYPACQNPAKQIIDFINSANKDASIGVFTYDPKTVIGCKSFKGKLKEERPLKFKKSRITRVYGASSDSTLWVHFREGSSEFDDIYKYCYEAKQLDESVPESFTGYRIPQDLKDALKRKSVGDEYIYLSNSTYSVDAKNRIWRSYWFKYMATEDVLTLFDKSATGAYSVHDAKTKIKKLDGTEREFFKVVKKNIVDELNSKKITEKDAWEIFAEKVHDRAHSYRIDVEAFAYGINFVDEEFKLSELGFRYVNSSAGDAFDNNTRLIFAGACLYYGNYNVFLQFLYNFTEEELSKDALHWTAAKVDKTSGNIIGYTFLNQNYRQDMDDKFQNNHLIKKSKVRVTTGTGNPRPPLKAEFSLMSLLELTESSGRVGVGVPINWTKVQEINDFFRAKKFDELG